MTIHRLYRLAKAVLPKKCSRKHSQHGTYGYYVKTLDMVQS